MTRLLSILAFSLVLTTFSSCGGDNEPMQPVTLASVSVDPITVLEGNTETKAVFASIRLSKLAEEQVTIFVETEDVSAIAGEDYVATSQSIVFDVGSVQENIKIEIFGDEHSELDETFHLNIVNVSGAVIGEGTGVITIENDDLGSGSVIIPSEGYETPEEYPGMTMIWSDEFAGNSLNESIWTYEIGNGNWGWGNNELQYYRRDNTSLVDGYLVIEALEEFINGFNYTSSRLITKDKFEFTHGRVDIRAVLPEGQGVWPALWMLGGNISEVSWPRCGEIDIMEIVGHEPNRLHGTVHYANSNGDHILNGESTVLSGGKKFSDEFNVFSVIWVENQIDFYLNDVKYHTVTKNSLGAQNPYPFNDPFFFIFNVAVGGNWPGSPDATTMFPQHMIVDYIRVFQPE